MSINDMIKNTSIGKAVEIKYVLFSNDKQPLAAVTLNNVHALRYYINNLKYDPIYAPTFTRNLLNAIAKTFFFLKNVCMPKKRGFIVNGAGADRIIDYAVSKNILKEGKGYDLIVTFSVRKKGMMKVFVLEGKRKKPAVMVKVGTGSQNVDALTEESNILSELKKRGFSAPQNIGRGELDNEAVFFMESFVEGAPVSAILTKNNFISLTKEVAGYLSRMGAGFLAVEPPVTKKVSETLRLPELTGLNDRFKGRFGDALENVSAVGLSTLTHGDVVPRNVLSADGGYVLIDWEYASKKGCPGFDIYHFMLFNFSYIMRTGFYDSFNSIFFSGNEYNKVCFGLIKEYMKEIGTPAEKSIYYMWAYLAEWYGVTSIFKDDILRCLALILEKGESYVDGLAG